MFVCTVIVISVKGFVQYFIKYTKRLLSSFKISVSQFHDSIAISWQYDIIKKTFLISLL
jgi:hypothetical protein